SSATVCWVSDLDGVNRTLRLLSGDRIQIWIRYDNEAKQMNVTVALFGISKPKRPLISTPLDLFSYLVDSMFVGFTSSTSTVTSKQYILGWSFTTIFGEEAPPLDLKSLPVSQRPWKEKKKLGTGIGTYILRLRRYRELKEDPAAGVEHRSEQQRSAERIGRRSSVIFHKLKKSD
ncbi:L-type lectin-domain containing receptor kinase I.3, partial [Linum perenne]